MLTYNHYCAKFFYVYKERVLVSFGFIKSYDKSLRYEKIFMICYVLYV